MIVNETIFELDVLLTLNTATVSLMNEKMLYVKKGLEQGISFLLDHTFDFNVSIEEITSAEKQLVIVNTNVKTLSIALLMKEAEPFEHVIELEHLNTHIFCLN